MVSIQRTSSLFNGEPLAGNNHGSSAGEYTTKTAPSQTSCAEPAQPDHVGRMNQMSKLKPSRLAATATTNADTR